MAHSLLKELGMEFDKQEGCDVFFSASGEKIGAHKFMLKVRSRVLHEMASDWNHGDEPISIDSMDFASLKTVLRFMYTDELPLSNSNAFIFLSASLHFMIYHLQELCADHISKTFTAENVCEFMNEAVNYNSSVLQEKCRDFFSKQTKDILLQESFLKISQPALSAMLDAEGTNVLEIHLFGVIKKWMRHKCIKNGGQDPACDGASMREVIGDALYKIRFPTMNVQDFANSVAKIEGFLTESETAQVFKKITVFDNQDINCLFPCKFRCRANAYYTPFFDMIKLFENPVMYNAYHGRYGNLSSMVSYVKDMPNGSQKDMTNLCQMFQGCADLANSSGTMAAAESNNKTMRDELYADFKIWTDLAKTKDVHDIMTKYMEMRTKVSKIFEWP